MPGCLAPSGSACRQRCKDAETGVVSESAQDGGQGLRAECRPAHNVGGYRIEGLSLGRDMERLWRL